MFRFIFFAVATSRAAATLFDQLQSAQILSEGVVRSTDVFIPVNVPVT